MSHPAFARARFFAEMQRIGLDYDTTTDCLDGLAILLGNRERNGLPIGACPSALRALFSAENIKPHQRAEEALARAEKAEVRS